MKLAIVKSAGPARLGRFELRRELGRGAQATVWLAWDGKLEREVAVKLLDAQARTLDVNQWLHEARAVSRLHHPNVVPVFEAGDEGGQPYLVFEYVDGRTLTEHMRGRGPMPPRDAATLMMAVLDGLAAAHAVGIVHRDLKPSNVLIGADGRPRVMDFGIAAKVSGSTDGLIVGTPGFMSPEASRGEAPTAAMDVFAAGMLMGQMLTGEPLLRERDPFRAIERIQHEDMILPDPPGGALDDGLRAIVQRAIARDPLQRLPSAAAMRDALAQWLAPKGGEGAAASSSTLEFLLRRMRHKSDFPALSDAVARIQRVANSESASLAALSAEIMKDVALTHKLLRLVNTAHFSHAGGGNISTVSRAVALVGFAGIRNLAMSLVLLEHMRDKTHASRLRDEFLRSLAAAMLASSLCPVARITEEAFLVGMLQTLGRLLTEFYFPEEAQRIRELENPASADALAEAEHAAKQVLGIGFEELGLGVARAWGLPEAMQKAMRRPQGAAPRAPASGVEYLRWLGHTANMITEAMLATRPEQTAERIDELAESFARVLDLTPRQLRAATEDARGKVGELAQALGVLPSPGSRTRRLLGDAPPAAAVAASPAAVPSAAADAATLVAPTPAGAGQAAERTIIVTPQSVSDADTSEMLTAGIQDVTQALVSDAFKLDDVLRAILGTMVRALALRRVVMCLREPRGENLIGRFGLGDASDAVCKAIRVPLRLNGGADLFTAVCVKGADLLIDDARAGNIAPRLPQWYRTTLDAPAFLLLPMTVRNAPFGLIYADKAEPGSIHIGERELALLRTLRNQAVMAFKTAGLA